LSKMEAAARSLDLHLILTEIQPGSDIKGAYDAAVKQRAQAVLVMQSPTLDALKDEIVGLGARRRLPVFAVFAFFAASGALLSYGPNIDDMVVRSAAYIHKIFHGVSPAKLPIQRPTKFDLVVNLQAAKSLNLTIGQSIVLRADQVIR